MSKVAVAGNASGTGVFTIAAPNSNTDRTLTLPDEAGQILTSASSLAAAKLTGSLPAGMGGKVLQVLSSTKTDTQGMTSTSFADITGLSVSITPASSSSKILVLATVNGAARNGWNNMGLGLFRDSTQIYLGDSAGSRARVAAAINGSANDGTQWAVSINFLDAPSTTSATTYKIAFRVMQDNPGSGIYINRTYNDSDSGGVGRTASTITVMEIAA